MKDGSEVPAAAERFGDARDDVMAAASQAGYGTEIHRVRSPDGENRLFLRLQLPNGKETRSIFVFEDEAEIFKEMDLKEWSYLGDYVAVLNRATGGIEALLGVLPRGVASIRYLRDLPGVEEVPVAESGDRIPLDRQDLEEALEAAGQSGVEEVAKSLRLRLSSESSSITLELSEVSKELRVLGDRGTSDSRGLLSLKISGSITERHDEALQVLERYAHALFFDMDVRFGLAFNIVRTPIRGDHPRLRRPRGRSQSPILLPRNRYAEEAASLYFYGRSANGMPLLQFLAYYQAIEFFFPSFWHAEQIRRLRNTLRDPRFSAEDDGELQRLIGIANGAGKGTTSERQQLRSAVDAAVEEDDVRLFLESTPHRLEFFTQKNALVDVPHVVLKNSDSLRAQIANRIYALRCRIVHSKEDGGIAGAKVLLPFGREAGRLYHDVELVKFVAQKVILAGSRGRL
ncbi:hypothetical protein SK571_43720 [Lentzea sp. BCCO 10_0798]|uniref:Uncharacterized protein n=1 Tax=Lentzea kristufekii TaxID=3095430 RepID=A0ABU4U8N7_9PSEU|nr:hypothetical protein [Lentzea sp. BCCO 10_0798]MDX8056326.1 hypothetical protein [Lentzea sp. BCCO 10_0798]